MELPRLHLAAEEGDIGALVAELEGGTDIELGTPGFNETALHRAAEHGNLDVVNALIESKADVNAIRRGGFTALHLAGTEAVADALLAAGIDPSIRAAVRPPRRASHAGKPRSSNPRKALL
jgi:ankyrin repeat protein